MASETTAAAAGAVGNLRRDPFAMLPFCGYNMADYFAHWLSIGASADPDKLPKIFYVNWFRKDEDGRWLWPGYGENSRVLEWVFERVNGTGEATETPIGYIPGTGRHRHRRTRRVARRHGEAAHRGPRRVASRGPEHPRALRHLRRQAPGRLRRRGGPARAAARLSPIRRTTDAGDRRHVRLPAAAALVRELM